jgi:hypothetical protein
VFLIAQRDGNTPVVAIREMDMSGPLHRAQPRGGKFPPNILISPSLPVLWMPHEAG